MKKLLIFLMACLFSLNCVAQEEIEHMKFMGIPITGKVSDFQKQLRKKGFRSIGRAKEFKIMKGTFDGQEAQLYIQYNKETKEVKGVCVIIPCHYENWAINMYNSYEKKLHEKYVNNNIAFEEKSIGDLGYEATSYNIYSKGKNIGTIKLSVNNIDIPYSYSYDNQRYRYSLMFIYIDSYNSLMDAFLNKRNFETDY